MSKQNNEIETNELCCYGCGNTAKYQTASGKLICEKSPNSCPINKEKNSIGLKAAYKNGDRESSSERYKNLPQQTKDKMAWSRGKVNAVFEYDGKGNHKQVLINERGHCCENCGLQEWLDQQITLELDHIDGDNRNNNIENLRLMCPNCHSLTETWRGRNIKRCKSDYKTDEEFIEAINTSKSIREALIKLGLTPKGGNYNRPKKLIEAGVAKLVETQGT